jgi:hypothetical protein
MALPTRVEPGEPHKLCSPSVVCTSHTGLTQLGTRTASKVSDTAAEPAADPEASGGERSRADGALNVRTIMGLSR